MPSRRTPRAKNEDLAARSLAAALGELGARLEPANEIGSRAMRISFGPTQPPWIVAPPTSKATGGRWTLSLSAEEIVELARQASEARRARNGQHSGDPENYRRSTAARRCGVPIAVLDEQGRRTFETDAWRSVVGELELPSSIDAASAATTRPIAPDVTLDVEPIHDARGQRVGSIVRAVTTAPAPSAESPVEHVFRRAVCALEGALATRGVRVEANVLDSIPEVDGDLEEFTSELLDFGIELGTVSSGQTLLLQLLRDPDPCVEARIPGVDGSTRRIGIATSRPTA